MKLPCFALLTLLAVFGQESSPDIVSNTGTVQRIGDREIEMRNGTIIRTGVRTRIWKNRIAHRDLSHLKAGDRIAVRYEAILPKPVAAAVSCDFVTISGVVRKAGPSGAEIAADSGILATKTTQVRFTPATRIGVSGEVPAVGQSVHVAGWSFGEDGIDAEKIAIYNTDLPARRESRNPR